MVRNWANGKNLPELRHLNTIEDVLFGSQRTEAGLALRKAREDDQRARQAEALFSFKAFGSPPGHDPYSNLMPPDAGDCYESLFRDKLQRDAFEDILAWLKIGHDAAGDWRELFCTMQERGSCAGIAFLSFYRPLKWWFGSCFGLLKDWRKDERAPRLLEFVIETCERVERAAKHSNKNRAQGIILEVDRFDEQHIETVLARCDAKTSWASGEKVYVSKEEKPSIEAALRISLYKQKATLIVSVEGEQGTHFLNYIQPAMGRSYDPSEEVKLWLMIYPFDGLLRKLEKSSEPVRYRFSGKESDEIFNVIYNQLFPAAYAREYYGQNAIETGSEGYSQYTAGVRARVEAGTNGKSLVLVSHNILSPAARRLIGRYGRLRLRLDDNEAKPGPA